MHFIFQVGTFRGHEVVAHCEGGDVRRLLCVGEIESGKVDQVAQVGFALEQHFIGNGVAEFDVAEFVTDEGAVLSLVDLQRDSFVFQIAVQGAAAQAVDGHGVDAGGQFRLQFVGGVSREG